MTRAALYLRVSTADQAERSIPAQEAACRAWCEQHGAEVVSVFKDEGRSAWSGKERPAFEAAKAGADAREFDVLVVDAYDRLSRGADHESILGACWAFKALGVEVQSANEDTPADSALASMLRLMYSITANQESERKSARSKRGAAGRVAAGKHPGRPPFGYRTGDDGIEPDPATAHEARAMFEDFADGVTQAAIARGLEARGVPSVSGGRWVQGTVRGILRNPTYCGRLAFKGETVDGTHEPLVSVEVWDRCQSLMGTRGKRQTRGRDAESHLLSRLVECGLCGERMLSRRGEVRPQKGGRYETYVCPTAAGKVDGWCEMRPVPREALDRAVIEHFTRTVIDVDATRDEWAKRHGAAVERAEARLAAAEGVLTAKRAAAERVLRDYTEGKIDVDAWVQVRAIVEPEHKAAESAVEAARAALDEARSVPEPDIEAKVAASLKGLHEAVAVGLDNADTVAAVRAQLGSVFESFAVFPGELPDQDGASLLASGWTVLPSLRPEAIEGSEDAFRPVAKRVPFTVVGGVSGSGRNGAGGVLESSNNNNEGLAGQFLWPAIPVPRS